MGFWKKMADELKEGFDIGKRIVQINNKMQKAGTTAVLTDEERQFYLANEKMSPGGVPGKISGKAGAHSGKAEDQRTETTGDPVPHRGPELQKRRKRALLLRGRICGERRLLGPGQLYMGRPAL